LTISNIHRICPLLVPPGSDRKRGRRHERGGTSLGSGRSTRQSGGGNGPSTPGFLNFELYAIGENSTKYAADFHDVTSGNNNRSGADPTFFTAVKRMIAGAGILTRCNG